jgi:hypothetical protein
LPEKPTNVSGDFNTIKSVNETDQDRGLAQRSEPSVHPRLIKLLEERKTTGYRKYVDLSTLEDPDHLLDPSGPLRGVRTLTDILKQLERGDL